jgi:NADH dehydrogenase/NADH:ubiquinone oxidoreductase subunit G
MPKCLVPIQNLYEKNGLLFNLEGRLRKLNKVVSHPKNTYSLEIFLFALLLQIMRQKNKASSKDIFNLCEQI